MNIVVDSIAPPVAVESAICLNEDSSRCVVVVRVPQSQSTPHAIAANTKVYIRTGNRNKPEELADLDRIELLQHRRGDSVSTR